MLVSKQVCIYRRCFGYPPANEPCADVFKRGGQSLREESCVCDVYTRNPYRSNIRYSVVGKGAVVRSILRFSRKPISRRRYSFRVWIRTAAACKIIVRFRLADDRNNTYWRWVRGAAVSMSILVKKLRTCGKSSLISRTESNVNRRFFFFLLPASSTLLNI